MPKDLKKEMGAVASAIENIQLEKIEDLFIAEPELIEEINKNKSLAKADLVNLVSLSTTTGDFLCLDLIKLLIENGIIYQASEEEAQLALKKAAELKCNNVFIYLLAHYLKEADNDFQKLKFGFFSFIKEFGEESENLLLRVIREIPELKEPVGISSIFFTSPEQSNRSISSAASFDPVKALEGKGLQVSVAPSLSLKKKTLVIDHSFLNNKERRFKQIRRLIAEGFRVLTFNGRDNFIELKPDFENTVFEQSENFPFAQKLKKYYKILGDNFSLPRDEVLLLDSSRLETLDTLFYSPLYFEEKSTLNSSALLIGANNIEKLPKDDLGHLVRIGKAKDLDDEEILRLVENSEMPFLYELAEIAIITNQSNVLNFLLEKFNLEKTGFSSNRMRCFLNEAMDSRFVEIFDILLGKDLIDDDIKNSALIFAIRHHYTGLVKALLEKGADVNIRTDNGATALMIAVKFSSTGAVTMLLEKGADVNIRDGAGFTALMIAALTVHIEYGHLEILEALLEKADVTIRTDDGYTALMLAAQYSHKEVVEALLEKADVNTCKDDRATTLMIAAEYGHKEVVEALLEKADVNIRTDNGYTALMFAAQNGHKEVVEALLEKGADSSIRDNAGFTALMLAAKYGHKEVVEALLEKADVNICKDDRATALMFAARYGYYEIVKALLEKGADSSIRDNAGFTALMIAAQNGHYEIVKALLEKADVTIRKDDRATALMIAAQNGHKEVVEALLDKGADVNIRRDNGATAPMFAAECSHKEVVEALLDKGADVNTCKDDRATTLMIAAQNGHYEIVKALLEKADVNLHKDDGYTALMFAAERGYTEIVKALLKKADVNVNIGRNDGYTALMFAAQNGHYEIVKALLEKADVNLRKNNGSTALMIAAQYGHKEVVEALLKKADVDVNIHRNDGATALMFAAQNGHKEVVEALLKKADVNVNLHKDHGYTALMFAAQNGHKEVVEALLKKADVNVNLHKDDGYTALMIAVQYDHYEIAKLLLEKNAKTDGISQNVINEIKSNSPRTTAIIPTKKEGIRINIGLLSSKFLSNSDSQDAFQMALVGEMMNSDKLKESLPYPLRTRVRVQGVFKSIFVTLNPDERKNIRISKDNIATLQQQFETDKARFKESSDKAYCSFSKKLKKGKATQLLSVNYPAELVGIKVDNDAKIISLFQDEFGFYNVKTDKSCNIEYVLEIDHTNLKTINDNSDLLRKIIAEYKEKVESCTVKKVPKRRTFQSVNNYLDQIFITGAPAACGLRTAAFMHRIKTKYPNLLGKCRVIDIDRNHSALEVKIGENPNDFVYVDLGGIQGRSINVDESYSYNDNSFEQNLLDSYEKVSSLGIIPLVLIGIGGILSLPFLPLVKVLSMVLKKKTNSIEDIKEDEDEKDKDKDKRDKDVVTAYNPALSSHGLKEFIQSQNSQELPKIKAENIRQLFLPKGPSLLVASEGKSFSCANSLIKAVRKESQECPIFYIDSPKQIDILKRVINITSGARDINDAQILRGGFLSIFLQEIRNNASNQEEDLVTLASKSEKLRPLLVINWSNFTAPQRVAFNSIIDDHDPSVNRENLSGIKIVSICDEKIDDESFLSRHAEKYQPEFEQQNLAAPNSQDFTDVDLKGASDWRQQLFGRISLQNNQIIWTKSTFVSDLENGKTNFLVSNCSNIDEFNQLVEQAKAFGYFFYNGYKIPLREDLQITPAARNFDFSKFSTGNTIIKNKILNQVSAEYEIINTQIFDFLLRKKEISPQGEYLEGPGFIELAMKKPDRILKLFISSKLAPAQYYSLFCEATAHIINLELSFAVGVEVPSYLTSFVREERKDLDSSPRKIVKAKVFVAENPRLVTLEKDELAVEVEDCSFQDLFSDISYKIEDGKFSFRETKSEFVKKLESGVKICLRGEFSEDLLQMLQPFLTEDYAKNLRLIIENKDRKTPELLEFLGKDNYSTIESAPVTDQEIRRESYKTSYKSLVNASDAELICDAESFIKERKYQFESCLREGKILALYGSTGIGKTSLVHEYNDVHKGFENFDNWISRGGILFLDESNIINSHLTMFEPMKRAGDGKIFYQGKFHQLDEKKHRVVFAYNPTEYGGGRVEQKLFSEGGMRIFEMQQLPASYIYYLLKKEVFDKTQFCNNDEVTGKFLEFCKKEIIEYQKLLTSDSKEEITTIRPIQEKALQFLSMIIDGKDEVAVDEKDLRKKYPYAKNIVTENFVSTDATIKIENDLGRCLDIRQKQKDGLLPVCGTNGILIEGASGIGKSALIKAYLEDAKKRGLKYHEIKGDMEYEEQERIIKLAYIKGEPLFAEEIDTYINSGIERLLNSALSGIDPSGGSNAPKAGFMLIATSNGITQAGRSAISPAIKSRLNCLHPTDLSEYKEKDIEKIIKAWQGDSAQLEASIIAKEYLELRKDGESSVNLRVLRGFIKGEKTDSKPTVDISNRNHAWQPNPSIESPEGIGRFIDSCTVAEISV